MEIFLFVFAIIGLIIVMGLIVFFFKIAAALLDTLFDGCAGPGCLIFICIMLFMMMLLMVPFM